MGAPAYASSGYGALVLSALVPLILLRVRIEEGLRVDQFGDEYRARTKKLIPFVW